MTLAAYNGHEALTFPDYLDLGTGKTLHAEPGETYDIAPASGRLVPDIPQGWFTPAGDSAGSTAEAAEAAEGAGPGEGAPAEGDGAPDLSGEEAGGEPGEDEHSAF